MNEENNAQNISNDITNKENSQTNNDQNHQNVADNINNKEETNQNNTQNQDVVTQALQSVLGKNKERVEQLSQIETNSQIQFLCIDINKMLDELAPKVKDTFEKVQENIKNDKSYTNLFYREADISRAYIKVAKDYLMEYASAVDKPKIEQLANQKNITLEDLKLCREICMRVKERKDESIKYKQKIEGYEITKNSDLSKALRENALKHSWR